MKIYLAGKIEANCWRHTIVDGLDKVIANGDFDNHGTLMNPESYWPVLKGAIYGEHDYVGPFFSKFRTGLNHGDNSHGLGYGIHEEINRIAPWETTEVCFSAIDKADLLFCWIDTFDCFGTITEIGYARGRGIPIALAMPPSFKEPDMWFPICASIYACHAETPLLGLHAFIDHGRDLFPSYKKHRQSALEKTESSLLLTEVLENLYDCIGNDNDGERLEYYWSNVLFFDRIVMPSLKERLDASGFNLSAGKFGLSEKAESLLKREWSESQKNDFNQSLSKTKIIEDAERIANKGSAAWRELLEFAVIRPLKELWSTKGEGK